MNTETKPEHSNIAAALAAAQAEMGKALKQADNPHFRSKYADLGNVMDACLPALNANGFALIQPTGEDEFGRYVETVLAHTSGERFSCRVPLIIGKNDMQGYGSAVTYARRYGLMCMAGVAPEDDDGNAAAKSARENPVSAGIQDAWAQGVLDRLPENATARQKAQAFSEQIIADFQSKTGIKALENDWARREKIINSLNSRHPDLWGSVVEAFQSCKATLTDPGE